MGATVLQCPWLLMNSWETCAQCPRAGGSFSPVAGAEGGRNGADIAHCCACFAGGLPETGSCLGTEAMLSLFAGTSRTQLKLWRQLCRKAEAFLQL